MPTGDEREFRLRPRKPRTGRSGETSAPVAFKAVMRYARMHRRAKARRHSGGAPRRASHPFHQRCAVRVTYSRNKVKGQWRAHGRYVAREGATRAVDPGPAGFDGHRESVDIVERLGSWQRAGDERMWKLIISPEFGERIDLQLLTRELMGRVARNLGGAELEWVAVAHYNTEHPHVHVALRGVDREGLAVRFRREDVRQGIRDVAEDLCTQQLGYRTQMDAEAAERRELQQFRFTSLDRAIIRSAEPVHAKDGERDSLQIVVADSVGRTRPQHIRERLMVLQRMGLAEQAGHGEWRVHRDFESVLRSMQRLGDRQKMLAAHGVPLSDERLPVASLEWRDITTVEGRVLVHGEEEDSRGIGRSYLMLESTDARVHHICYAPAMEELRNRGRLQTNSFIRLRRLMVDGSPQIEVQDLGPAEAILRNRSHLRQTAQQLIRKGIIPEEDQWGGWLGRYRATVRKTMLQVQQERESRDVTHKRERERDR
jgi:type IV secretory pathway VirD2 relaxase